MTGFPAFNFEVTGRDPGSRARTGRLATPHGVLETPAFIFCATKAAIKALAPDQVRAAGAQIVLGNSYHLMIRPGADVVARLGGLHRFMGWDGPMLTDSGGFQIFSMSHGGVADEIKGRNTPRRDKTLLGITEEGAHFRSYTDGRKLFLSPEGAMEIQRKLGADLIMPLDECTAAHSGRDYTAASMERSHRWEDRCLAEFARHDDGRQALYGIIQGGIYPDLREISARFTRERPFFGTAIGGSLGQSKAQWWATVDMCTPHIHPDRPVHLLGIGGIDDAIEAVRRGMDSFDCVSPTRIARHGWALVKGAERERINLRNARFREADDPIDPSCDCRTCHGFATGYIHHLLRAGELLALQLISQHNIRTMTRLMADLRAAVPEGRLDSVARDWRGRAAA